MTTQKMDNYKNTIGNSEFSYLFCKLQAPSIVAKEFFYDYSNIITDIVQLCQCDNMIDIVNSQGCRDRSDDMKQKKYYISVFNKQIGQFMFDNGVTVNPKYKALNSISAIRHIPTYIKLYLSKHCLIPDFDTLLYVLCGNDHIDLYKSGNKVRIVVVDGKITFITEQVRIKRHIVILDKMDEIVPNFIIFANISEPDVTIKNHTDIQNKLFDLLRDEKLYLEQQLKSTLYNDIDVIKFDLYKISQIFKRNTCYCMLEHLNIDWEYEQRHFRLYLSEDVIPAFKSTLNLFYCGLKSTKQLSHDLVNGLVVKTIPELQLYTSGSIAYILLNLPDFLKAAKITNKYMLNHLCNTMFFIINKIIPAEMFKEIMTYSDNDVRKLEIRPTHVQCSPILLINIQGMLSNYGISKLEFVGDEFTFITNMRYGESNHTNPEFNITVPNDYILASYPLLDILNNCLPNNLKIKEVSQLRNVNINYLLPFIIHLANTSLALLNDVFKSLSPYIAVNLFLLSRKFRKHYNATMIKLVADNKTEVDSVITKKKKYAEMASQLAVQVDKYTLDLKIKEMLLSNNPAFSYIQSFVSELNGNIKHDRYVFTSLFTFQLRKLFKSSSYMPFNVTLAKKAICNVRDNIKSYTSFSGYTIDKLEPTLVFCDPYNQNYAKLIANILLPEQAKIILLKNLKLKYIKQKTFDKLCEDRIRATKESFDKLNAPLTISNIIKYVREQAKAASLFKIKDKKLYIMPLAHIDVPGNLMADIKKCTFIADNYILFNCNDIVTPEDVQHKYPEYNIKVVICSTYSATPNRLDVGMIKFDTIDDKMAFAIKYCFGFRNAYNEQLSGADLTECLSEYRHYHTGYVPFIRPIERDFKTFGVLSKCVSKIVIEGCSMFNKDDMFNFFYSISIGNDPMHKGEKLGNEKMDRIMYTRLIKDVVDDPFLLCPAYFHESMVDLNAILDYNDKLFMTTMLQHTINKLKNVKRIYVNTKLLLKQKLAKYKPEMIIVNSLEVLEKLLNKKVTRQQKLPLSKEVDMSVELPPNDKFLNNEVYMQTHHIMNIIRYCIYNVSPVDMHIKHGNDDSICHMMYTFNNVSSIVVKEKVAQYFKLFNNKPNILFVQMSNTVNDQYKIEVGIYGSYALKKQLLTFPTKIQCIKEYEAEMKRKENFEKLKKEIEAKRESVSEIKTETVTQITQDIKLLNANIKTTVSKVTTTTVKLHKTDFDSDKYEENGPILEED